MAAAIGRSGGVDSGVATRPSHATLTEIEAAVRQQVARVEAGMMVEAALESAAAHPGKTPGRERPLPGQRGLGGAACLPHRITVH
jgi:hypothetical protein